MPFQLAASNSVAPGGHPHLAGPGAVGVEADAGPGPAGAAAR